MTRMNRIWVIFLWSWNFWKALIRCPNIEKKNWMHILRFMKWPWCYCCCCFCANPFKCDQCDKIVCQKIILPNIRDHRVKRSHLSMISVFFFYKKSCLSPEEQQQKLQHWSHLNDFSPECVLYWQTKVFVCEKNYHIDHN